MTEGLSNEATTLGHSAADTGQPLGDPGALADRHSAASELHAAVTEQSFSETRLLFHTLLEHSPDMIYFKDRQSRFVHYSKSYVRLFRLENADSLKGKTDADVFAP